MSHQPVPLPRVEGAAFTGTHVPLIERYPRSTALRGGRPARQPAGGLDAAAARAGDLRARRREVHLKLEGANPTGSFKDRGMTCAVSAAVRDGAKAVICASTGNTAASAAAYAARAGITCAVIVPEGNIAHGQDGPDADPRSARDRAVGQLRPGARARARAGRRHTRSCSSTRSTRFRIEGQKTAAFEILEDLDGALDSLCIPVGNAGNITSYWRGFREAGAAPRMFGFQAEGAAPLVAGRISRAPRDGRQRDPHRQPDPLGGRDGRDRPSRAGRSASSATRRSSPPTACSPSREGMFCEPASAASVAGLLKYGAEGAERVVCVLTGRGLKDPDTALEQQRRPGDPLQSPRCARSRKPCWVTRRRCLVRVPASSANLGPGFDCLAVALGSAPGARGRRDAARFAVETDLTAAARPRATCACAASSDSPPRRASRSGSARQIPLVGRSRVERRGDRRRPAGRRRPPVRARRRPARAGDRARGPSRQRRRRAARRLRRVRRRPGARFDAPPGSRRSPSCPRSAVRTRAARAALPAHGRRSTTRSSTSPTASLLTLGLASGDSGHPRAWPAGPPASGAPREPLPALL